MNRTGIALLSTAALLAAGSATAGEMDGGSNISWNYAQLGYVSGDGNDFFETDGFDLLASLALAKNWHVGAGFRAMSNDFDDDYFGGGDDIDADTWSISAGYNAGLTKNSQGYFDIGYYDTDVDVDSYDGGEGDSDGIFLTAGFRYQPSPKVELGTYLVHTRGSTDYGSGYGDVDYNDTSVNVMGQYFFTPAFSLGASASFNGGGEGDVFSSSGDELNVFVRWSFGDAVSDASDSSDASY